MASSIDESQVKIGDIVEMIAYVGGVSTILGTLTSTMNGDHRFLSSCTETIGGSSGDVSLLFTTSGMSSDNGEEVIVIFPDQQGSLNKTDYNIVDVYSERIYDKITGNNELSKGMIIAKDQETAMVLEEIDAMFQDKEKAVEILKVLKEVLEKTDESEKKVVLVRELKK